MAIFNAPPTNLTFFGRLADDPDFRVLDSGKLKVEFFLYAVGGNPRYKDPLLEFVSFNKELSEYIAENFHKGDLMYVTEGSPMRVTRRQKNQPNHRWTV